MSRILIIFASTLFVVQTITAQCVSSLSSLPSLAYAPELATGRGSFSVRSSSPIAPTGVKILSDQLVIEGPLVIDGQLPFLGTVALEGAVPSVGVGNVAHSCGGAIGISSEIAPAAAAIGAVPFSRSPLGPGAPGVLGSGLGAGAFASGCNRLY